jgi:hypothetical protein
MKKAILLCCIPWLLLNAASRTFYSDWGWGYYYWLFGPIGPSWSEGMAAAGYSSLEYRGFVQMSIGGWPGGNVTINSLQLRLRNNTGGAGLQIDINRVTSATPGWTECGETSPVYLTNQPVTANAEQYTYFELAGTQAGSDFLSAWQSGAPWFGFGLKGSRGSGEPCMHFFYAFWADDYYDAALIIDYTIGVEENGNRQAVMSIAVEPNPFRTTTNISIGQIVPWGGSGAPSDFQTGGNELRIYDAAGRQVRFYILPTTYSLLPTVVWDGTDHNGRAVPPGVYLAVLKTLKSSVCRKIVKIE